LAGWAARYNAYSVDLGGFIERIERGAFAPAIANGKDVPLCVQHDRRHLTLARRDDDTLKLFDTTSGLFFIADIPDTELGRWVLERVRDGRFRGMSFGFSGLEATTRDVTEGGRHVQIVQRIPALRDISLGVKPAYKTTKIWLQQTNRGQT